VRPLLTAFLAIGVTSAHAATIQVGAGDSYAKIEAAQAGDEVVIAPGRYAFRVHLTRQASASAPIVIRAQDPSNPPVWDLGASLVENAPGSYTAGDRGRGCWQISGGTNYHISGIVFTNCRNAGANSAGLRYYNGARGILVRDCTFRTNDNGITGGTQDSEITVEFSEFDRNGNLQASTSAPTHNIYVYGGTFTLRFSYVHDPVQGQNFHIRSRSGVIEYSWIARGRSYEGDLMTDDDIPGAGSPPYAQTLLLRGNLILQDAAPQNRGQIIAVYNDAGRAGLTLGIRLVNNTIVGNGGHASLVHLSNADGTAMTAELSNNLVYGTTVPALVETASAATVTGTSNWLPTGASPGPLASSVQSASPGFRDTAAKDFTLAAASAAIGAASPSVSGLPDAEYYRDEAQGRMYRLRASTRDIGAFESTTGGAGIGPYGAAPPPSGGSGPAAPASPERGSGCGTTGGPAGGLLPVLFLLALLEARRTVAMPSSVPPAVPAAVAAPRPDPAHGALAGEREWAPTGPSPWSS